MVTCKALYAQITAELTAAGCEDAAFDAGCLMTDLGGISRGEIPSFCETPLPDERAEAVRSAAAERAGGRPLQYILGEWDFLDLTLSVGEGVLIPRPDTELLCETARDFLYRSNRKEAKLLDLCAGSGCVGLGTASLAADFCKVCADEVELSPEATVYLQKNLSRYPQFAATCCVADVLTDAENFAADYDVILSNPPYIPHKDLPTLQREVCREPQMALDGGDGYVFYRAIAADWLPHLKQGGLCAVEVGIGQAQTVAKLFDAAGLRDVRITADLGGIDRVVSGIK